MTDLLTSAEAAKLCGTSISTWHRWVSAGRISPAYKSPTTTGAYLFRRSDVEALAAELAGAA